MAKPKDSSLICVYAVKISTVLTEDRNRDAYAYLSPIAEKRRVFVVFGNGLVVEIQGYRPIMLDKGLVPLLLQRSRCLSVGRHRGLDLEWLIELLETCSIFGYFCFIFLFFIF